MSYGVGTRPTLEVFSSAGIYGVVEENLDLIIEQLILAYLESKQNMFGTPMPTKDNIQNVVDQFLIEE